MSDRKSKGKAGWTKPVSVGLSVLIAMASLGLNGLGWAAIPAGLVIGIIGWLVFIVIPASLFAAGIEAFQKE
ncbi:hypothetical protein [Thiomonas sp.]